MATNQTANFAELLEQAIQEPGKIHAAYSAFYGYSLGNRLLAAGQCAARDIPLGPIATFHGWKAVGRHVSKGQKAISLCMPVTCKRPAETVQETNAGDDPNMITFTRFIFRNNWFVLAQTEGEDYTPPQLPNWDKTAALTALNASEVPFDALDGNCQGYARAREIAVSPIAALPIKTMFHEIAHVLLGHTADVTLNDGERTPKNLREIEAESVALLCCAALDLPGAEYSRGYIQHWNASGESIPEASARKIMKTADLILKAGHPKTESEE